MFKGKVHKYGAKGIKRGEAPLRNSLSSPLMKGRGIKGEGLVKSLVRRLLYAQR